MSCSCVYFFKCHKWEYSHGLPTKQVGSCDIKSNCIDGDSGLYLLFYLKLYCFMKDCFIASCLFLLKIVLVWSTLFFPCILFHLYLIHLVSTLHLGLGSCLERLIYYLILCFRVFFFFFLFIGYGVRVY